MARYVCEADHEAQSHSWRVIAGTVTAAVCAQRTPTGPCTAYLYECSWCERPATAHGRVDGDLIHACDSHAEYLDALGVELPRCAECGDAVAWPTEWFCPSCSYAIDLQEAAL